MSVHRHDHGYRAQSRRALGLVLALTSAYTVCEIVGGWLTGSLALLADAGHMLGDSAALALALVAAWLAGRPATPERSFGYRRAEILAALANGVALAVIAIWVFIEAVQRLDNPREILGGWMLAVALIGLVVNVVAAGILSRAGDNLNVRAALRHVFADLAGSVGVAVGGAHRAHDRLGAGRPGGGDGDRRADPRQLVVDRARRGVDPARGDPGGNRR